MTDHPSPPRRDYWIGIAYALGAFGSWGVVNPVYMKVLSDVPPFEILAHRIVWSSLLAIVLIGLSRNWSALRQALRPRSLLLLSLSAVLISINWTVFLLSILDHHLVDASFGYFMNPLVSVALGIVVLGERPRPLQLVACAIAVVGVAVPVIALGKVPWIALILAVTFGFYGLVRKMVRVEALVGFSVEVVLLLPIAAAYLLWQAATGASAFAGGTPGRAALLVGSGAITAAPLIWFSCAARRLPLSTVGVLQFISPSGGLMLAVFAYGEPFARTQAVAFGCIWTALALYVADGLRAPRPNAMRRLEGLDSRQGSPLRPR